MRFDTVLQELAVVKPPRASEQGFSRRSGETSIGATTTIAQDKLSLVVGLRCSILGFASTTVVLDGSFSLAGFDIFDRCVAGRYRRLHRAFVKVGIDRAPQKWRTVPWQCTASAR